VIEVFVRGISVWGPGLAGFDASRATLTGEAPYVAVPTPAPASDLLSATERRRTGVSVRLAMVAAQQAMAMAGLPAGSTRSVFATANADGAVVHAILETLAGPDRQVSPTQFHNSVHNAAAGYWSIATGSRASATSIGCHDATFGVALLKAAAEARVEAEPVLLCVYDAPLPWPLAAQGSADVPFAAGFLLSPDAAPDALARLRLAYVAEAPAAGMEAPMLAALRPLGRANPAARALRLLEHLARRQAGAMSAAMLDGRVDITVDFLS
jgi:hypothetical protein